MRILQVVNTLATMDGGPARVAFELNLAFNSNDVRADLFWVRGDFDDSVAREFESEGASLPDPGPRRIAPGRQAGLRQVGLGGFVRCLREADAVVIHGYYLGWIPMVVGLSRFFRTPYAVTPHGVFTRHQRRASRGKKWAFEKLVGWWVRRGAAVFVTDSQREADELLDAFPGARVAVAGVGTRLPRIDRTMARHEPLRMISVSRIAPKKRIDLMIDAVAELETIGVPTRLWIAGTGDSLLLDSLKERARAAGVAQYVEFLGEVVGNKKELIFLESDVFLLPSDDENFGIALAESLAYGVPVVASSMVAAAEFLNGHGGMVLENPTGRSIADAIVALMGRDWPGLRGEARAVAEAAFDWRAVAARWTEALTVEISRRT